MRVQLTLRVDERKESADGTFTVECHVVNGDVRLFGNYLVLSTSSGRPEVKDLAVGDRLRLTLEREPAVSELERTIEEAERAGLNPAILV